MTFERGLLSFVVLSSLAYGCILLWLWNAVPG
jgi:hypothetical protein